MSRAGYSADEAFDRLRHMSQTPNTSWPWWRGPSSTKRSGGRDPGIPGNPQGRNVGHSGANATDPDPPLDPERRATHPRRGGRAGPNSGRERPGALLWRCPPGWPPTSAS
ncbi:MAG TPA: ANTAR domain-containing protein [Nakamurella sp.]|nr:ANTAR domain-containing protein [Nakamurella sp.]